MRKKTLGPKLRNNQPGIHLARAIGRHGHHRSARRNRRAAILQPTRQEQRQGRQGADRVLRPGAWTSTGLDVGQYPSAEQGLAALRTAPANLPKWAGPYLKRDIPVDPWGNPYQYKAPGQHGDYDLISLGSDAAPGGVGEAADVTSW